MQISEEDQGKEDQTLHEFDEARRSSQKLLQMGGQHDFGKKQGSEPEYEVISVTEIGGEENFGEGKVGNNYII